MKLSVIIPVFNAEKTIKKCLESILSQKYKNFELIAVNDGSTDNTKKILEEFEKKDNRVKIISFEKNQGKSKARNEGIKKAEGELIAFTDADCVPEKNWLFELAKGFENENVQIVQGKTLTDKRGIFFHSNESKIKGFSQTSNVCYEKKLIESIGGFDERFRLFREDLDLQLRAEEKGAKIKFQEKAIVFHPAYKRNFFDIVRFQKHYFTDALYFKKHPEEFRKREETQKPFYASQVFRYRAVNVFLLSFIVFLLANFYGALIYAAIWYAFSVFFGFLLAARERKNTSFSNLVQLVFLNFLIFFSTAYFYWKGILAFGKVIV